MNLKKLIEQFRALKDETDNEHFKKSIDIVLSLLEQIEDKDIPQEEQEEIQQRVALILENVQTQEELKPKLKELRKTLKDFGFVPNNYYQTIGIGAGLAIGTSLGISFGAPYDQGIVFGPMIGSGIGIIGGIFGGMFMDKKKVAENRVLKDL